jgi:hypothetical protein
MLETTEGAIYNGQFSDLATLVTHTKKHTQKIKKMGNTDPYQKSWVNKCAHEGKQPLSPKRQLKIL